MKLSVQLYTVRDLAAKDFAGTLKELAKIGYRACEGGGGWGNLKSAADAKKAMDDAGLVCSGMHANIGPATLSFHWSLPRAPRPGIRQYVSAVRCEPQRSLKVISPGLSQSERPKSNFWAPSFFASSIAFQNRNGMAPRL